MRLGGTGLFRRPPIGTALELPQWATHPVEEGDGARPW